jgi:hypothetical protein
MCTAQVAKMLINPVASMAGFGNQKTQPVAKQKQTKGNKKITKGEK